MRSGSWSGSVDSIKVHMGREGINYFAGFLSEMMVDDAVEGEENV